MNKNSNKKRVLISGGSRGIGRCLCESFSNSGCKVAFIYKSCDEAANEVASLAGALAIKADVSRADEATKAVARAYEYLGGFDVLINNAAISQIKLFTDTSDEDFSNIINTNLGGAFFLSREVARHMISQKSGAIINIGSMWGKVGASCEVHYSAAKAGLRGMTMALAKELGPSSITVNCIEPGVIQTDMNSRLSSDDIAELCENTPLGRIGKPYEVAQLALFLSSDNASFITGQIIGIDGGYAI